MLEIQRLIKSVVRILCLKTLPQALHSTYLIKVKPLEICLPCLLVQKVVASFHGEIENSAISLVCCLFNQSSVDCVYRLFIQHFESGNETFDINQKKAAFQDNKI